MQLKFAISPYWVDTGDLSDATAFWGHSTRAALTNVHYYLGFFFLQGHFWHAMRALGFNFKSVTSSIGNEKERTFRIDS